MKTEVAAKMAEVTTGYAKHGNVKTEVTAKMAEVTTGYAKHGNVKTEATATIAEVATEKINSDRLFESVRSPQKFPESAIAQRAAFDFAQAASSSLSGVEGNILVEGKILITLSTNAIAQRAAFDFAQAASSSLSGVEGNILIALITNAIAERAIAIAHIGI
ncbi:MAG: hypothetical protein V7K50_01320 [Nostoc sp.]|uniref:hypothetical protein n=1 Tax=Nostoc sp. TaxID=1180 RepID=UPI002FF67471